MDIRVVVEDVTRIKADAVIVNLFEGVKQPGGATGAVDQALGGAISQLIAAGEVKGKLHEMTLIHSLGKLGATRVVVAGLGKQEEFTPDRIRGVAAESCRFLRKLGAQKVATIVHGAGAGGISPETAAQAIAEGAILGLYTFKRHQRPESDSKEIEELIIVDRDESRVPLLERGIARGKIVAEATNMARDWSNEPANCMTPSDLAEAARKVAEEHGLEVSILEPDKIGELGMGGLLGVAQGSRQPPRFIILSYRGNPGSSKVVGLVGKGITFDSGGISIKPSEGMGDMKGDMAGGAAVIAAIKALAQLQPRVNVTILVPATENMPGGAALKPGDVIKAHNGKTIEVINTDAEGRLIVADALAYARKQGFSPVIDVATLTGACMVALGLICTGAFTNNQPLMDRLAKAAEAAGEKVWQMPMFEEYKEQNKSDVADIKNTGNRYGGAITAAQFLAEFIEDTPWVHLDIAGTARAEKEKGYQVKGATGVPVRMLVNLVLSLAEES